MSPVLFWWIISDDYWLPKTFYQSKGFLRYEEVYNELHFNRFTYYPLHEQPRFQRDYMRRECLHTTS